MSIDGQWVVIEVMGHKRLAGVVREVTLAGKAFLRVDVPAAGGIAAFTRMLSPDAVFSLTPVDEELGRRVADRIAELPVDRLTMPVVIPALGHAESDGTHEDPVDDEPDDAFDENDPHDARQRELAMRAWTIVLSWSTFIQGFDHARTGQETNRMLVLREELRQILHAPDPLHVVTEVNQYFYKYAEEFPEKYVSAVQQALFDERETGVHESHCCKKHGCKYGEGWCPVAEGYAEQAYPQECCEILADVDDEREAELARDDGPDPEPEHPDAMSPDGWRRTNFGTRESPRYARAIHTHPEGTEQGKVGDLVEALGCTWLKTETDDDKVGWLLVEIRDGEQLRPLVQCEDCRRHGRISKSRFGRRVTPGCPTCSSEDIFRVCSTCRLGITDDPENPAVYVASDDRGCTNDQCITNEVPF